MTAQASLDLLLETQRNEVTCLYAWVGVFLFDNLDNTAYVFLLLTTAEVYLEVQCNNQ